MRENADGSEKIFAIQFWKKDGELVSFVRAKSCGLKINMKENRVRGVVQVDQNGNNIGHVYTINIDLIKTYNGVDVKL